MFWKKKKSYNANHINVIWRKILDNQGPPRARQYILHDLLNGLDLSSHEGLKILTTKLLEITCPNLLFDYTVEIIISNYDIEMFSYTGFPAIEDLELVFVEYSDLGEVKSIFIKYNPELIQFVICELVILIANCANPAHDEIPWLSDTKHMAIDDVLHAVFQGYGLILLHYNNCKVKVYTRSEVFHIPHDYILSNDDLIYALSLWNSMNHLDFNLTQAMNYEFSKKTISSIEKLTLELKQQVDFQFERSEIFRIWLQAHLQYEQCKFDNAIKLLISIDAKKIESEQIRSEFYFLLGECYFFQKRFEDALECFDSSYLLLESPFCLSYILINKLLLNQSFDNSLYEKLLVEESMLVNEHSPDQEYLNFITSMVKHYNTQSGLKKNFEFQSKFKQNELFIMYFKEVCALRDAQ